MNKELSESDISTKVLTPGLRRAGWDEISQLREEVSFTNGRIIARGKLVTGGNERIERVDRARNECLVPHVGLSAMPRAEWSTAGV